MPDKLYNEIYLKELESVLSKTFKRSIEILNPKPNDKIADIGCGVGSLSFALAEYGASVFGIDNDTNFLDIGKANNSIANPVTFLLGEAENIDIPDSSFDKIVFHRVFQHLFDYKSVLTESIRTLKSGGVIHIAEPDYLSATFFSENIDFEKKLINIIVKEKIPNSYKLRTLPQLLKQIGFNSLNIEVHNYIFNSFPSANHLINFDKNVIREFQTGRFSQSDLETWNNIKSTDINCFNFSFNMILVTAQKP